MSSQYELETQPELKNQSEGRSGTDSGSCINTCWVFFKSGFVLSFLALFLKKNSFIPSKKAQEVESGFKRWNPVSSQDLTENHLSGERVADVKLGQRQQANKAARSVTGTEPLRAHHPRRSFTGQ